jgi:NhaA family Na+:H+ antiporter
MNGPKDESGGRLEDGDRRAPRPGDPPPDSTAPAGDISTTPDVAEDVSSPGIRGAPPGSWHSARTLALRAMAPVERFLQVEAASGILLIAAAVIALFWANSPWRESYADLWHVPLGLHLGTYTFERDLHFWINDGVMTIFFFVVGLEIRREIHVGELSEARRAALPLAAAMGGMIAPALIFATFNAGHEGAAGWGIPMATDIAFAVGVLSLLGSRVPAALRVLLLALAVIDDVGAIVVIAVFYSSGLSMAGFVVIAAGLGLVVAQQLVGVRNPWAYVPAGIVAWSGAYAAGIHPTLVGVALGLMTPVRAWLGPHAFVKRALAGLAAMRRDPRAADERALMPILADLGRTQREAVSPVERLQHALHGWVAFGAMPLFALANAGVALGDVSLRGETLLVFIGVTAGLMFGKPAGILVACWLATRTGVARLPRGVGWSSVLAVGFVAGIGFTMSIFIAGLAYPPGAHLETAKLAIVVASCGAAVVGLVAGRVVLRGPRDGAAATASEAEASTRA